MALMSIVVNFFNNRREARNTLYSLTRAHQRDAHDVQYEVIAVDHGSSEPLSEREVRAFGPEFSYRYVETRSVSPVQAINAACRDAAGERLLVIIDGAHIVSPGVFHLASMAFRLFASPFIATVPFHLGEKHQSDSVTEGYNQQVEDALLAQSGWKENGYRLYAVAGAHADASEGWFGMLFESGCFGLRKQDYLALGGFDERFQARGGGLVNLDFFQRALATRELKYTMLVGEGTFHQFHGGVASNMPRARRPWDEFHEEYVRIRGTNFVRVPRRPFLLGALPKETFRIAKYCSGAAFDLWTTRPALDD
jgi:glycosyl transferase family 2